MAAVLLNEVLASYLLAVPANWVMLISKKKEGQHDLNNFTSTSFRVTRSWKYVLFCRQTMMELLMRCPSSPTAMMMAMTKSSGSGWRRGTVSRLLVCFATGEELLLLSHVVL